MKKIVSFIICYLLTNLAIAANASQDPNKIKAAGKEQKTDLMQWNYTTNQKGGNRATTEPTIVSDPNGCFEENRKITNLNVNSVKYLTPIIEQYIEAKQVATINSRLYNVGAKGQPAPTEPNLELYHNHFPLFCSPLSGYESILSDHCKKANPLKLQHADLRPPFLEAKFDDTKISFAENWIDNFLTPAIHSGLPVYIEKPELLTDTKFRDQYILRLRNQIPVAVASNSLNVMLAERIPVDPKNPNSPSILSSIENEVERRHLNNNWHEAIMQTNDGLELQKQQTLLLALISYQLQRLDNKIERLELLNAALVNNSSNQQELTNETIKILSNK